MEAGCLDALATDVKSQVYFCLLVRVPASLVPFRMGVTILAVNSINSYCMEKAAYRLFKS